MTKEIPHIQVRTIAAIGSALDTMLQQRVAVFAITYDEKKRIADPATLISELLHGVSDPHFQAVSHYQVGTTVYPNKTVITLEIAYLENDAQLRYVNNEVATILMHITTPTMQSHQKIMAIHDWVTSHISYDETRQRRTAYDGLSVHATVCSGYASLFWHLCSAAAIPCRIVTGTGKFEAHAWNMVQLDAYWYHIDSTWSTVADSDSPFSVYRFYLLNDNEIQHTHRITPYSGAKPLPRAHMQYRAHLNQLERTPRLHAMVHEIRHKTGLAYLEPEHTIAGISQLSTRVATAVRKRQTRVIFGYRGAVSSVAADVRDAITQLNILQDQHAAVKVQMYPMPHGFVGDGVLIDMHFTYT